MNEIKALFMFHKIMATDRVTKSLIILCSFVMDAVRICSLCSCEWFRLIT